MTNVILFDRTFYAKHANAESMTSLQVFVLIECHTDSRNA